MLGFLEDTSHFIADTQNYTNAQFVNALYNQLLDRAPDVQGYTGWWTSLESGAQTREQELQGFINSREYQANLAKQKAMQGGVVQLINPTPAPQAQAANATTASGDTTQTSQQTLSAFTDFFTHSTSLFGYTIPNLALVGVGVVGLWLMTREGHRGRF